MHACRTHAGGALRAPAAAPPAPLAGRHIRLALPLPESAPARERG